MSKSRSIDVTVVGPFGTRTASSYVVGNEVAVGLKLGYIAELLPDQAKMKAQCKRAVEPDFAFDCLELTSALLDVLDGQTPYPMAGIVARKAETKPTSLKESGRDVRDISVANAGDEIATT